jgi:RNA polymerase sigma-70 factor (ECF subfamily)
MKKETAAKSQARRDAPRAARAREDDRFAAELVDLRRALYARALFMAQDRFLTEDLVQEAIERALLARGRFRHGSHLRAWLGQILRNLFIDARRRVLTRTRLDREAEAAPAPAAEPGGPFEALSHDDILAALASLEAAQREVIVMACLDGLSYRQIAARMGIPASTVGTRLLRARRRLRRLLEQACEDRLDCRGNA